MGQIQYSEKYFDDVYEYRSCMWFFLLKWPRCSRRTDSSPRMSGVQLGFSRAGGGFTMRSTARSRTSCSSGGPSTTSSSRSRLLPLSCLCNEIH
ncbi:cyclin-dependent kinases regulatory subunit [Iris pallida]|uniref:Cyclin-dependent kinases regulatory subunit n=1 Tax=Iris pallida TaxID=29817 RepID=A0AAX6IFL0_IRIPA|nr:cyclin-dependent kinases regulatory subunit [Iris pallida]KAJ6852167.1 cyclin-dependent kinases regulatory subunit [Iris pallida]